MLQIEEAETNITRSQINQNHKLMKIDEAASFLGVTVRGLYDMVARRTIPFRKVGRLLRFDRDELTEWSKQNAA